jgi:hypothetical protein
MNKKGLRIIASLQFTTNLLLFTNKTLAAALETGEKWIIITCTICRFNYLRRQSTLVYDLYTPFSFLISL